MAGVSVTIGRPTLRRSADTKTSPCVIRRAAKFEDPLAAAYGTPAIEGCECSTEACEAVCYAAAVLERFPSAAANVGRNLAAARAILADGGWSALADAYRADLLEPFAAAADRRGVAPLFRWYWSGEVLGVDDARAVAAATASMVDRGLRAWIYTRYLSVRVIRALLAAPNLAVYLSVDADNVGRARRVYRTLTSDERARVHLAPMAEDAATARQLAARVRRGLLDVDHGPTIACPAAHKWPNTVPMRGSVRRRLEIGEAGQGACARCGHCVHGRGDVAFQIH